MILTIAWVALWLAIISIVVMLLGIVIDGFGVTSAFEKVSRPAYLVFLVAMCFVMVFGSIAVA